MNDIHLGMFKPSQRVLIFSMFLLLGFGCQAVSDTQQPTEFGSRVSSLLGDDFYGYMHWTQIDPGLEELQYTVGGEADIILHFTRSQDPGTERETYYDIDGVFEADMATMVCSGNESKIVVVKSCNVKDVSQAKLIGAGVLSKGLLTVTLSWDQGFPQETTMVETVTPIGTLVLDQVSATFSSGLNGEVRGKGFVGSAWTLDVIADTTPFVEDAFAVSSEDESGTFSDLSIPYALKSQDEKTNTILDSVAHKDFAASPMLLGKGSGSLYLFDNHPNETALKSSQVDS